MSRGSRSIWEARVELIAALALGILGILGAVLSRLLADDFKAWTPRIVESLIRRAIRRLPESMRERFTEEWRSDVNDTPGDIGKLVKALGFRRAARRMAPGFFADNEETWFGDLIKRVVDVALVSPLLIFLSPILVFTAVLIRIESRGPILYRQERVGLHGRLFTIFKFRTMAVEAEARESPRWIHEPLLVPRRLPELEVQGPRLRIGAARRTEPGPPAIGGPGVRGMRSAVRRCPILGDLRKVQS